MKLNSRLLFQGLMVFTVFVLAPCLPAATLHVDVNSSNPIPPFTNWATAARVIQDAVDAAGTNDTVLVTNGVYLAGGRPVGSASLINRVAVEYPLRIRSVNGPEVTLIQGLKVPGPVRCVYLAEGGVLDGFTLTNGAADLAEGGGFFCYTTNATVTNCVIAGNSARLQGGGAYGGTLYHCKLSGNSASGGGGAAYAALFDCTLTGNSAAGTPGGGAAYCTLYNCTISSNSAPWGGGAGYSTLSKCLVTDNSTHPFGPGGVYDCTLDNCVIAGNQLGAAVNCKLVNCTLSDNQGGVLQCLLINCILYSNTASGGQNHSGSNTLMYCCTTPLPGDGVGNFTTPPQFLNPAARNYRLQSSSPCINVGANPYSTSASDLDGNPRIVGSAVDVGAYEFQKQETINYVWLNSPNPKAPYTNWATAAHTIQDAVDAAALNGTVLVTNGVYLDGGRPAGTNTLVNRVAVERPMTLRSVNGPQVTLIQGYQVPVITNGPGAVRCVYLCSNAVLSGFTLTNGATSRSGGGWEDQFGGGVRGEDYWRSPLVSNCVLVGNSSFGGGGAFHVTLVNCSLSSNSAHALSTMSTIDGVGGGAYRCVLRNCTLVRNWAENWGGGTAWSPATNCIIYYNTIGSGSPAYFSNYFWERDFSVPYSCCVAPTIEAYYANWRNITSEPRFVTLTGGDFHLQADSPCINAGYNPAAVAASDLDGNPRIVGGTVDLGAYEFQSPGSTISYAWLQQFGLPNNGSADTTDLDADGHNNRQEWKAGTIPTNKLSVLRMMNPVTNTFGLGVSWLSVADRTYFLERATNFGSRPPFFVIRSNLTGQAGTTSFTDSSATGPGPFFYRVGVQE